MFVHAKYDYNGNVSAVCIGKCLTKADRFSIGITNNNGRATINSIKRLVRFSEGTIIVISNEFDKTVMVKFNDGSKIYIINFLSTNRYTSNLIPF